MIAKHNEKMGCATNMNYTKNGNLSSRIIHKENILEIATFFEKLHKENDGEVSFEIVFKDKSSISDDSATVFENHIIKRKDLELIYFSYIYYKTHSWIKVRLNEVSEFSSIMNTYEIHSCDGNWYNAIQKELEDILFGLPKQNFFRQGFRLPWCLVTYFLFLIASVFLMTLLGFEFGELPSKSTNVVKVFIPLSLWWIVSIVLFAIIVIIVCHLWPEMEFSLDSPIHIKRKKIRKTLGWIFTAIIVPIVLSILLNVQ